MGGVALLATTPFNGPRLYEQRLAAALGTTTEVAYVEPARSPRSFTDLAPQDPSILPPGVSITSPWTVPYTRRLGLNWPRSVAYRLAARTVARRLGGSPLAVVHTESNPMLRTFPDARRVALIKDDYVAGAALIGMTPQAAIESTRAVVTGADAVVCVSPVLREKLRAYGVEAHVIPAGCTLAPRIAEQGAFGGRAVFIGGLSPRVLPGHLRAVIDAGLSLTILGGLHSSLRPGRHRAEIETLLADPRVDWRGPVSSEAVREELARSDVGLVPYDDSEFTRASFPLKTLEYLAAGVPVVSTPMPALDWIGSDQVIRADSAADFGAAAADVSRTLTTLVRQACVADAGRHTWQSRADLWLPLLGIARGAGERT